MPPKKAPAKSTLKHDEGKDLRRAHEHRGRVFALQRALGRHSADIETLTELAEKELTGSYFKDAADLFRAAEHLSFGVVASEEAEVGIPEVLAKSLQQEFEDKRRKAVEHWKESEPLNGLYENILDGANKAFNQLAYRRGLELVRAAEALAHVHLHEAGTDKDGPHDSDRN